MPLMPKPSTVTVLPVPTFFVSKLALVLANVKLSPESMSLVSAAVASVVVSYTLSVAVALITRSFLVMAANVVVLPLVRL